MEYIQQQFRQHLRGAREHVAGGNVPFRAVYTCYSAAFLHESDRDRLNVENGGKILLPQVALEKLIDQPGVMLFKLNNEKKKTMTHCGVLDFHPNDNKTCYLPNWMMRHLLLQEGDSISLESVGLELAKFVRFQPQSPDFLDISNPKAVLEKALRTFACLTKDDVIAINYLNRNYELLVLELKPNDAVKIIECDMEVDFAPPVGYVEPKYTTTASQNIATTPKTTNPMAMTPGDPQPSMSSSYKSPAFMPFYGAGNRLNGKMKSKNQDQEINQVQMPQTRGIPNYDYEYGTVQFLRTPLRSMNEEPVDTIEKSNANQFQPFSGTGQILKSPPPPPPPPAAPPRSQRPK